MQAEGAPRPSRPFLPVELEDAAAATNGARDAALRGCSRSSIHWSLGSSSGSGAVRRRAATDDSDLRLRGGREPALDLQRLPCLGKEGMELELQSFIDGQAASPFLSGSFVTGRSSFNGSGGQNGSGPASAGSGAGGSPRLLDRSAVFKQSKGRLNVRRVSDDGSASAIRREDLFHTLVSMRTSRVVALAAGVLVTSWLLFAALFRFISAQCGLEAGSFVRALYLAIETIETIGYGVPDAGFHGCHEGLVVVGAAALWESLLNALIISVVYARFTRPQSRASSVVFSQKAIVRAVGGHIYFLFQVCDFRKHQLCEAHVRLYSVQHRETDEKVAFQTRAMRLQHPDDTLGGMLLLALPQLVVHRIDAWSPLCPPSHRNCEGATPASGPQAFAEAPQRAMDAENGTREAKAPQPDTPNLIEVAQHLAQAEMEVLCIVEGIEPSTSGTLQARCSYSNEDIVYNAAFQRCVTRAADGACLVNFNAFHELVPCSNEQLAVQSLP